MSDEEDYKFGDVHGEGYIRVFSKLLPKHVNSHLGKKCELLLWANILLAPQMTVAFLVPATWVSLWRGMKTGEEKVQPFAELMSGPSNGCSGLSIPPAHVICQLVAVICRETIKEQL